MELYCDLLPQKVRNKIRGFMSRQKLLKFSIINLVIGLCLLLVTYFFFHFVTDNGIELTWQPAAGKPFVTDMLGQLSVLFIFASSISAIAAFVLFDKENKNNL